jgi:hypothetical protein
LLSWLFLKWVLFKCGNLHKPTDFFVIQSFIPGTVLMSPNATANLSLWQPK